MRVMWSVERKGMEWLESGWTRVVCGVVRCDVE